MGNCCANCGQDYPCECMKTGPLSESIHRIVDSLTPREQEILKKRFSSDEHNEVTEYAIEQMASRIKKFPVREGYEKEPENKVDIVKVIEHHDVKLEARGRMHVGLCPFCDEPSFWYPTLFANRDTGRFFCFKCSKKGTSIDFVIEMSAELLDFTHAMRMLSEPKFMKDKTMKIHATSDKIFIRRCKSKEVTEGGIIIPEAAKEKAAEGIVVSAGRGRCLQSGVFVPTTVKAGDKVLLPSWGAEVEIDGEKMIVVPEESILGVFEEE